MQTLERHEVNNHLWKCATQAILKHITHEQRSDEAQQLFELLRKISDDLNIPLQRVIDIGDAILCAYELGKQHR
jgi:hypothetical protein